MSHYYASREYRLLVEVGPYGGADRLRWKALLRTDPRRSQVHQILPQPAYTLNHC